MTFYAYLPDSSGREPLGTAGKILRHDLKSESRFIQSAKRILGTRCVVIVNRSDNFYNREGERIVYDGRSR